ncbi:glycosyltransferase [Roseomonas sp. E05]|uniref:glycosyltransferase n=1 Tax=Roseomonas sp. E05 TaxID=3046310 RepID=UPI0024B89B33|nr:glycosyltransferase [Roseomonas sp. E05]MDJ0390568.1 glycosyltransferase [Roseomonas sp. E05]
MLKHRGMNGGASRSCAAVVLHLPDPEILGRLAAGLRRHRLIAVANGPLAPAARAVLTGLDLRLIENQANLGLAAGLNAATRAAAEEGFDHVLLLDQDSEPPPGLIEALTARADALASAGRPAAVVAPRLLPPDEGNYRPIRYAWRGRAQADELAAVDFAPTSGSLTSLAAYAEIGPFREDFFIAGIDIEWGFRAWDRGWGSYVATDLTMLHRWGEAASPEEAATPQILRHAPVRNYYYTRNLVATARLPYVPALWRARSFMSLAVQIGLLALRGAPSSLRPVRAGLRDGVRGRMGPAPAGLV